MDEIVRMLPSLVVAIGGIAAVRYRYRGAREQAVEDARKGAAEAFEELFREERALREANRVEHVAEIERKDAEHKAEIAAVQDAARLAFDRRWTDFEKRLRDEHAREIAEWKAGVREIVTEVARLVAQLDPYRTPTPTELDRLRTALARGHLSPADINGLIAARGVAT